MDKAVFEEFYPKIYNYVYYRILKKEDAEDITGDVFYKALANETRFDVSRSSYSTWMFTIARNSVANYYRDKKDTVSIEEIGSEICFDGNPAEDSLINDEEARRLRELLKTLPERDRTVLTLRFWGGLSYKDIAEQTNLSVNSVGVILKRAMEKLKPLCERFYISL